jgi:hypothetical protein
VRVKILSGPKMHLMAVARDVAGDVHWLFPMYREARTRPSSVPMADGIRERVLGEMVQPEGPSPGSLRVVTLLSTEALTVKDVEARLADRPPTSAVAPLFPGVVTAEWTARWTAEP